jgi:hypothetical protein
LLAGVTIGVMCAKAAFAQTVPPPRFGIADNSFLVEEAFNQEAGIFQNIFVAMRSRTGQWDAAFTQEWPVGSQRHQLSFTLPFSAGAGSRATGDVLINYRLQVMTEEDGRPAFSPRLSAVLPSSASSETLGWQVNLPFSKQAGRVYFHGNAGGTWQRESEFTPFVGGSAIVALRPMFHLMFETFMESTPAAAGRDTTTTIVPGFRTGWNAGDRQFVVGFGVPVTRGATRDHGILTYLSYELPFSRR